MLTMCFSDQWVSKFEREYELCYKDSVCLDLASGDTEEDVEAVFEELHRRVEAEQLMEYASRKFDSCVPSHTLLDNGASRNKARLNHRKSFREQRKSDSSKFSDEKSVAKMDCKARSTNTVRESSSRSQKQVSEEMKDKRNNSLVLSKDAEVCANQSFLTIAIKPSQQNEYEDIRVFQKRKKKKKDPKVNCTSNKIELERITPVESYLAVTDTKEKTGNPFNEEIQSGSPALRTKKKQNNCEEGEKKQSKEKRPFESFQNCLFTLYTACVPWSCMRRVYWKQNQRSEEIFTKTSRRNSRARLKRAARADMT